MKYVGCLPRQGWLNPLRPGYSAACTLTSLGKVGQPGERLSKRMCLPSEVNLLRGGNISDELEHSRPSYMESTRYASPHHIPAQAPTEMCVQHVESVT